MFGKCKWLHVKLIIYRLIVNRLGWTHLFLNVKDFAIKILLAMLVLIFILVGINYMAFLFEIRPQSVAIFLLLGYIVSKGVSKMYDRVVKNYDDLLPKYVLDELEQSKHEIEVIKNTLSTDNRYNVSLDEIEVMAKNRKESDKHEIQIKEYDQKSSKTETTTTIETDRKENGH